MKSEEPRGGHKDGGRAQGVGLPPCGPPMTLPGGAGLSQWRFIKLKPMKMLTMVVHEADSLKGPRVS